MVAEGVHRVQRDHRVQEEEAADVHRAPEEVVGMGDHRDHGEAEEGRPGHGVGDHGEARHGDDRDGGLDPCDGDHRGANTYVHGPIHPSFHGDLDEGRGNPRCLRYPLNHPRCRPSLNYPPSRPNYRLPPTILEPRRIAPRVHS